MYPPVVTSIAQLPTVPEYPHEGQKEASAWYTANIASKPDGHEGQTVARLRRLERWALQSAARELLFRDKPILTTKDGIERWPRTCYCLRSLAFGAGAVDVLYTKEKKAAHYRGLQTCGSVWACPICAAKISERRRIELSEAIRDNPQLHTTLITYTLRHNSRESLVAVRDRLLKAYRALHSGGWFERIAESCQIVGTVRALELTHGANGWHVHLHCLQFSRVSVDDDFTTAMRKRWAQVLARFDGSASWANGVDVRTANTDIAQYISKYGHEPRNMREPFGWSKAHEVAKSVSKKARGEGRASIELLADFAGGDKKAGLLWREYARAMRGCNQLVWSRGLRKELGLTQDKTDEEVAAEQIENAEILFSLPFRIWQAIARSELRGQLLEIAATRDYAAIGDFLDRVARIYTIGGQ